MKVNDNEYSFFADYDSIEIINTYYGFRAMFENCSLIKSLPDFSYWNEYKVIDISLMFSGCSSLKSLPDISK